MKYFIVFCILFFMAFNIIIGQKKTDNSLIIRNKIVDFGNKIDDHLCSLVVDGVE